MHNADRGLYELRRGRPIVLFSSPPPEPRSDSRPDSRNGSGPPPVTPDARLVAGVEGLLPRTLAILRALGNGPPGIVVTRHRASALGLVLPRHAEAARWTLPDSATHDSILHLASAPGKLDAQPADLEPADSLEAGGVTLARMGRFVPAVVTVPISIRDEAHAPAAGEAGINESAAYSLGREDLLEVGLDDIRKLSKENGLELSHVSSAPVPLDGIDSARFHLFRETRGLLEHLAIVVGEPETWSEPVPVRVHSACLTGDLFGSLRCDCGEQLRRSLEAFARAGGGVLCYLCQEGRGIGLGNKLRAYQMQEDGLDTVDADCTLGFGADERSFAPAVDMLRHLGVGQVRLFTNNPAKVNALREGGIQVDARQSVHGTLNVHNLPYLSTKSRRAGHLLDEVMARPLKSNGASAPSPPVDRKVSGQ